MEQGLAETGLPSFSIVLETENLANADVAGLVRSLASLAAQDPSPATANEVLLIDSGDTPTDLLTQLCQQYPWIQVVTAPAGTGYYQAKMLGANLATGEIVVYYDSDCLYEPHWLRSILTPFVTPPAPAGAAEAVQVVAGETMTRGVGPYGTAMALTYIFPQFSGQQTLTPTTQYFLNNVAFRRQLLLQHPIPGELPLYRGNCVIHAHDLLQAGYTIWKQPLARATHAPPNGLSHFFWRFLLIGHDYYWQRQLLSQTTQANPSNDPTMTGAKGKLQIFQERMSRLFANNPLHALFLPLSIPVVLVSALLIYVGFAITKRQPSYLLKTYSAILGEV